MQCPECDKYLSPKASACTCGWKASALPAGNPCELGYRHVCQDKAVCSIVIEGNNTHCCVPCRNEIVTAEHRRETQRWAELNGITPKVGHFLRREMVKLGIGGRYPGWFEEALARAKELAGVTPREPGSDDEGIAA